MKSGFSAPFADWVIDGWQKHSEAIGGPEKARRVWETLKDPAAARKRAEEAYKRCKKNQVPKPG